VPPDSDSRAIQLNTPGLRIKFGSAKLDARPEVVPAQQQTKRNTRKKKQPCKRFGYQRHC